MAGMCKSIKAGAKALKKELTREVLKFGIETMGGFSPLIADGKLTKAEAGAYTANRIAAVKKISLGAANAAVTILAAALKAELEDVTTTTSNQVEAVPVVLEELESAPDDLDGEIDAWIDVA